MTTMMGNRVGAVASGLAIGTLGGLIGLGGAEFRLPLLLGPFAFAPLEAVILNKAMSLVVVTSALPSRTSAVPWEAVLADAWVIGNLLVGSMAGAWTGAAWATRMGPIRLRRTIAVLLLLIAGVLLVTHSPSSAAATRFDGVALLVLGVLAGFLIGGVAAFLGVAGGELLIPTLVLLFGVDVKLAGSLSLCVSLPTMLVAFARYSRDRSFVVLNHHRGFVGLMAIGSVLGTYLGGRFLPLVPAAVLLPALSLLLAGSALRIWRHH